MDYAWQNIKLIQSGNMYINPKFVTTIEDKGNKKAEVTLLNNEKIKLDVPAYEVKNAMLSAHDEKRAGTVINLQA